MSTHAPLDEHPVLAIFAEMEETVRSKAQDYADMGNVFSNFEGSAKLSNVSVEQTFQVLIGVKVERLRQLTSGKEANHESIEDTLIDLANYAALWLAYRRTKENEILSALAEVVYLDSELGEHPPFLQRD